MSTSEECIAGVGFENNQDEAIVLGDEDLLVEVYGRLQRQSWARWRDKVPHLLDLLDDNIPVSSRGGTT